MLALQETDFLEYSSQYWIKPYKLAKDILDPSVLLDLCSPTDRRLKWLKTILESYPYPSYYHIGRSKP